MILSMSEQAKIFLVLVVGGMSAGLLYDFVRVARRLIKHGLFWVQLEDLLYWLFFTVGVMLVLLWENNGVLRVFSVIAPIIGMVLYFCLLSRFFMVPAVAVAGFLKKVIIVLLHIFIIPLELFGKLMSFPITILKKMLCKFNKIVKKLLKNIQKCAKIINRFWIDSFCFKKGYGSEKVEERNKKKKA